MEDKFHPNCSIADEQKYRHLIIPLFITQQIGVQCTAKSQCYNNGLFFNISTILLQNLFAFSFIHMEAIV